jgi:copper chaperone CopZ
MSILKVEKGQVSRKYIIAGAIMKKLVGLLVLLTIPIVFSVDIPEVLASERTIQLHIDACDCPTTVPQVTFILQTTPGVQQHDVNVFSHVVTVTFNDEKTSVETIKERLTRGGFPPDGEVKYLQ